MVAEGGKLVDSPEEPLVPGQAAEKVAKGLQALIAEETYPLIIGPWARGGNPTAVDQQIGDGIRGGAMQALKTGRAP